MNKQHILDEILRTATENGGVPLGKRRFESETGIKESDWSGRFWVRWNEAIQEAGFSPNKLNVPHDEDHLLQAVATLALELGRFPVQREIQLKRRSDPNFPSDSAIAKRYNSKALLAEKVMTYCATRVDLSAVVELCRPIAMGAAVADDMQATTDEFETGYVYLALMKIGKEKRYKIGKADIVGRRTKQIAVNLPEELELIHAIATDDAYGIEAYWHRRFDSSRRGGEWFSLTADDVKAFRRRKFM